MSKKLKKFLNDAEKTESKIAELEEYLRNVRAAQKKEEDSEIIRAIRSTKMGGRELLALLDVLVDGRFVQAEHDISLRFRGSRNQRLLDVPKSLAAGQPVWWEDEKVFATHTMER